MDILIIALLLGIPATYILRALLLEQKESHEGPVLLKNRYVVIGDHYQRASVFDVPRRLFGAYRSVKSTDERILWLLRDKSPLGQVWTCPFCLSFWVALLFSVPYTFYVSDPFWFPVFHFGIATTSQIAYKALFDED